MSFFGIEAIFPSNLKWFLGYICFLFSSFVLYCGCLTVRDGAQRRRCNRTLSASCTLIFIILSPSIFSPALRLYPVYFKSCRNPNALWKCVLFLSFFITFNYLHKMKKNIFGWHIYSRKKNSMNSRKQLLRSNMIAMLADPVRTLGVSQNVWSAFRSISIYIIYVYIYTIL
jgi:hypothetical protein